MTKIQTNFWPILSTFDDILAVIFLVNCRANFANFTLSPSLDLNVAQLDHGFPELDVEGETQEASEAEEALDEGAGRGVGPQHLVRLQDPAPVHQVREERRVESARAARVQRHSAGAVPILRAQRLQLAQERWVYRRVGAVPRRREVEQPVAEELACCRPDRVPT